MADDLDDWRITKNFYRETLPIDNGDFWLPRSISQMAVYFLQNCEIVEPETANQSFGGTVAQSRCPLRCPSLFGLWTVLLSAAWCKRNQRSRRWPRGGRSILGTWELVGIGWNWLVDHYFSRWGSSTSRECLVAGGYIQR